MSEDLVHTIEKIAKMLEMLLNDKQKEEIKKFDIEYYNSKIKELNTNLR